MKWICALHKKMSPIYGDLKKVTALTQLEKEKLFSLMDRYYQGMNWEQFCRDLDKKNRVILLKDSKTDGLIGFSTLYIFTDTPPSGTKTPFTGVFSGDTIIDQAYWGASALQFTFGLYLMALVLKRPWRKVHWFLISKGYKTYLLMANNFTHHFPRHESPTPKDVQSLLHQVYSRHYPTRWQPESGLIRWDACDYRLRQGVAAPELALSQRNNRVNFFLSKNPDWAKGDELACMATMSGKDLLSYTVKRLKKAYRAITFHPAKREEKVYVP